MKVLVVYAHPRPDSFTAAVLGRAEAALRSGGHEVVVVDLWAEGFDPVLTEAEWAAHTHRAGAPAPAPLTPHVERLRWAEALVLVYPTWWGGPPAILKGWFDRVLVEGVAYELPPGARRVEPRLRHIRRLTVVTTHGSPKRVNVVQGEPGKLMVRRALRVLCHPLCRSRWVACYGMDTATPAGREAFLGRVSRALTRP